MSTRRTKIVATLGPACQDGDTQKKMLLAGMDVARINGSHGAHAGHRELIESVRHQAQLLGRNVAILYDLQGPKIRVGSFEGKGFEVTRGAQFTFAVGREPKASELPSDYAHLDKDVAVGDTLLIEDGSIDSEVVGVEPGTVVCRARNAGIIQPRKGINLPHSSVSAPAVTEKDKADAAFAASCGVDYIALSFVRRAQDVIELKSLLREGGFDIPIIAKIEKPQAIEQLSGIIGESFGVMVARGDLGVELLPEIVPSVQKRIISEANRRARPVITATQMLDSMRHALRPTRAEASDVANAVLDGSDALMLSNETAMGQYPVESIEMMARIIQATELSQPKVREPLRWESENVTVPTAVADACCQAAKAISAKALVCFTRTGSTATLLARRRPDVPIVAFAHDEAICNRMALVWGVRAFGLGNAATVDERVELLENALIEKQVAQKGDLVVVCMGAPSAPAGSTNTIMVLCLGDPSRVMRRIP